ncbi:MAG: Methionine aminopeptidase [Parcubacteria group bacterium GW2011_GWA2_38_13]|nr:MAG: Methionine aminopeptidase [Parcubacteria group bacterium GW2011_GWA2_38_13]
MVTIKTDKDIKNLRIAGKMLAAVLLEVQNCIKPGVKTITLDTLAEDLIRKHGATPAFKNYQNFPNDTPFPSTLCTSVNEEVVHAPASNRVLVDGDIIGVDIGLKYTIDGRDYFTDMARTIGVGKISKIAKKLLRVTKTSLEIGIRQVKPENTILDIGRAIQEYVESQGFSVVRSLTGHGVGYKVHEDPQIPNYVRSHAKNVVMKKGMVLAIEPMVNIGSPDVMTSDDGWTISTLDGSLSAHFEHTVVVTDNGYEILTKM